MTESLAQDIAPFARGDPGFRGGNRGRHNVAAIERGCAQIPKRIRHGLRIARISPAGEALDLLGFGLGIHCHDRIIARGERAGFAVLIGVDPDHSHIAAFNLPNPCGVGVDQTRLHIFDRLYGSAHGIDQCQLSPRALLECCDFAFHRGIFVEQILIFQKIGFIGHNLLHPQRPLLIPGARQAQSLIPSGQLHSAGTGLFG